MRPATREPFGVIEVVVDGGVVTLDGQVPSLSHKRLARAMSSASQKGTTADGRMVLSY